MPADLRFDEQGFGGGWDVPRDHSARAGDDPTLYHVLVTGQSNASSTSAAPALNARPQPGRPLAWMFNGGPRPGAAASQLAHLVPLVETDTYFGADVSAGESVCWGMAEQLSRLTGKAFLFSISATAGQQYSAVGPGTTCYRNLIEQVRAGYALARRANRPYRVLCGVSVHGEQDAVVNNTSYGDNVLTWQATLERDVRAVTGQGEAVPMYLPPQTYYAAGYTTYAATADLVRQAALSRPDRVAVVGGQYWMGGQQDNGSMLHHDRWSYPRLGAVIGRAAWRKQFLGEDWRGVHAIPGRVNFSSGPGGAATDTIVADFYCPVPPLAWDFSYVAKADSTGFFNGFSYFDDTSPPTITAATIIGPARVAFTLSGVPTGGNPALRAAWGTNSLSAGRGPFRATVRCNLRDSDPIVGPRGEPLYNWCSPFSVGVT